MPLSVAKRVALEAARDAGAEPIRAQRSMGLSIAIDGKRVRLSDPAGQLTEAGRVFFPGGPPLPFDPQQDPIQVGRSEYIRTYDGKRKLTRRFVGGRWTNFTKLGREFYERNRQTFVLEIPAWRVVNARNGMELRAPCHVMSDEVPEIGKLAVPSVLEGEAKRAYLREAAERLIASLPEVPEYGKVLINDSASYYYDPDGEWRYNEQVVEFTADGVDVETILERRLFGAPFVSPDIFAPWGLHPSSLLDAGGECVAVQLAALGYGGGDLEKVRAGFDALFEVMYAGKADSEYEGATSWRGRGINAKLVEAFAKRYNTAFYVLWNSTLVHRFVPTGERKHRQVLAMAISGDHGWFYSSPDAKRAIAQMEVKGTAPKPTSRLLVEEPEDPAKSAGDYSRWGSVSSAVEVLQDASKPSGEGSGGLHYSTRAEHVDALRAELIGKGVAVKVHMRSAKDIKALSFKLRKDTARVTVHVAPERADVLSWWSYVLDRAGLHAPYKGQSHAGYGFQVLRAAVARQLKFTREPPSREVREEIAETQGHVCCKCGEAGLLEIDHITPLSAGGSNERSNLHGICHACHAQKTYDEALLNIDDRDPLASVLSPRVHSAFHESPKTPQCVLPLRALKGNVVEIDAVRSRRNALVQNEEPLPVFCVLDAVAPSVAGVLADYSFVDKGELEWGTGLRAMRFLPYTGARWYWKGAVREMLDRGHITWGDVKLSLEASSHVPAAVMREAVALMERTLGEAAAFEHCEWDAVKYVVLGTIGILNTATQHSYVCRTSNCSDDPRFKGSARKRRVPDPFCAAPALRDGLVYDYVQRIDWLTWQSYRPIGQIALDMDLVHVAWALDLARRFCRPLQMLLFNVDCVVVNVAKVQSEKLKAAANDLRYPDGSRKLQIKPRNAAAYDGDVRAVVSALPVADAQTPEVVGPWRDAQNPSVDVVARAVLEDRGALLVGVGGTGKTHLAKEAIKALRALEHDVAIVAFTHLAAQNIGGSTIHAFLHAFPSFHGILVVDEASFVPAVLWNELARYLHAGTRFLVLGDFRGQFMPAYNTWKGTDVHVDVEESAFLRALCGRRRFELTVNRRSDEGLFDFYAPLCRGGAREHAPLQALLAEARARFPAQGSDVQVDWHLTVSNRARMRLNEAVNAHQAREYERRTGLEPLLLEAPATKSLQQEIRMFPGLRLVGSKTEGGVKNGLFYEVAVAQDGNKTVLRVLDGEEIVRVFTNQVTAHLRPAAALTYFGSQGRTLHGVVRLHDTQSPYFSKRHLQVGVGRGTAAALVQVT